MLIACWSVKGGAGVTVVSACLALDLAELHGPTTLVDCGGELLPLLGVSMTPEHRSAMPGDSLTITPSLRLLSPPSEAKPDPWVAALAEHGDAPVVVDCGRLGGPHHHGVAETLAEVATHSLLVLRPCFLSLRRAVAAPVHPSGVIVVREPGRVLSDRDVADVVGAPVLATVPVSPEVARAVDAGLFLRSRPVALRRALRLPVLR